MRGEALEGKREGVMEGVKGSRKENGGRNGALERVFWREFTGKCRHEGHYSVFKALLRLRELPNAH